jgi:hypothetical protein
MGTRHRSFRTPFTAGLLLIGCGLILAGCQIPGVPADVDAPHASLTAIRRPVGPDDLPDRLAGRWRISLCVSDDNGHAWIRFENADSGDVRSVGRYHLLVGGWFDRGKRRWNYLPTFRTGLHMDREQRREPDLVDGSEMLRTAWVEDPPLFVGGDRGTSIPANTGRCPPSTRPRACARQSIAGWWGASREAVTPCSSDRANSLRPLAR